MNNLKIIILIFLQLILSGCFTFFEPRELSEKNRHFLLGVPEECKYGNNIEEGCFRKYNPATRCWRSTGLDNPCVAEVYPQCYNSDRDVIMQECIEKLADQRPKAIEDFYYKKQKEKEAKEKEEADAKNKELLEMQRIRVEYEKSPEGIAERKSRDASRKKARDACANFLNDLVNTTNFTGGRLQGEPVFIMPYVVQCIYSGSVSEAYGNRPVVIMMRGNIKTGVYEYQ